MRPVALFLAIGIALAMGACANDPFYVSGVQATATESGDSYSQTVGISIAPNPRYLPRKRGLKK